MDIKYYPCFSKNQKDFLKSKGIDYLIKCRHCESRVLMWIFIYDDEGILSKYLKEWSESSPSK